jgi:gliding motility-associated lipoprotein GldD
MAPLQMLPHHSFRSVGLVLLLFFTLLGLAFVAGCSELETYPRKYGFHRLELPEHSYQRFDKPGCPFTFEYPIYAEVKPKDVDSCQYDLYFKQFGARFYITTRFFQAEKTDLGRAYEDYRQLVYKHTQKGKIFERRVQTSQGFGTVFELYGEVPTPVEVFFTDSLAHAFESSLYFNTALKNDSLAPVIRHLKQDMLHLVETLQWK